MTNEHTEDFDNIKELRVKADHKDIGHDERKKNVKKLAGAIAHSLRSNGEINVRAFGNSAMAKAVKALAIAREYIKDKNLKLDYAPAFIDTVIDGKKISGICYYTFAAEVPEDERESYDFDLNNFDGPILLVKGDDKETSQEDRSRNVKKLAGAISGVLKDEKQVVLRCFGSSTIGKASRALAIARGHTAMRGPDLYTWNKFIVADIQGKERTGIGFYAFTNEI